MNCYYSNLIEAQAHIAVQKWIDEGGLTDTPTSPDMISKMHHRFCEALHENLLRVSNDDGSDSVQLEPGQFRNRDVAVGRHVAISPGAIPRFLARMHQAYSNKGRIEQILAAACAHHRFLWVHPFLDGNGRVARLMSYAMVRDSLDTRGLWSIARGLARNESDYKRHLAACDHSRKGGRDGRGSLSESALADFVAFFLQTSIDQVEFMESLMKPDRLRERLLLWAREEMQFKALHAKSDILLRALLYQGDIARADVPAIIGLSERAARRVTSSLIDAGALKSESPRAPSSLAYPPNFLGAGCPACFQMKRGEAGQ